MNKIRLKTHLIILLIGLNLAAAQGWFLFKTVDERFKIAVEHYNMGNYKAAESVLTKLAKKDAGSQSDQIQLLLMKTEFQLGKVDQAKAISRTFLNRQDPSRYQYFILETLADIFVNDGNYSAAFRTYLAARKAGAGDRVFKNKVDGKILKTFGLHINRDLLIEMAATESDTVSRVLLHLALAFDEILQGNQDHAAEFLSKIQPETVPNRFFGIYEKLILAAYRPAPQTFTVGVVLPLTGPESPDGLDYLKGLQAAFKTSASATWQVSYQILDNRSNRVNTIKALSALIEDEKIAAVISPLTDGDALVAASIAMGRSTPVIIPYSRVDGLAGLSNNIYQMSTELSQRGSLAAKYVVEKLGLKSIAILAPSDDYGKALVDAFIKELDSYNLEPAAVQWYLGEPNDLKKEFSAIRSTAWRLKGKEKKSNEQYLGMTIDSLDALFDISTEDFFNLPVEVKPKMKKSDSANVVLTTIDGLFLPAHPEHITYLGTQFPMYNLKATLITNDSWYAPQIINKETIGPHINGMIVVSSKFPSIVGTLAPPEEDITNPDIYNLGYDTGSLLLKASAHGYQNQLSFSEELAGIVDFHGKMYSFSFGKNRQHANTAVHILRYNKNTFTDIGFYRGDSLVTNYSPAP